MAHGRMSGLGGSMEEWSTRPPLARRGLAWGLSSVGEHLLCKQGVTGSNPVASTIFLPIAVAYVPVSALRWRAKPFLHRSWLTLPELRYAGAAFLPIGQLPQCVSVKQRALTTRVFPKSLRGAERRGNPVDATRLSRMSHAPGARLPRFARNDKTTLEKPWLTTAEPDTPRRPANEKKGRPPAARAKPEPGRAKQPVGTGNGSRGVASSSRARARMRATSVAWASRRPR